MPSEFNGKIHTVDGDLYVRAEGSGRELVLLHGLGDSSVTWRKVGPSLIAAGFRIITIDALGAGLSDKPGFPYDINSHARRVRVVLDALGVREAVFVGNSLGGSVALRYYQLYPESVSEFIFISPAAYPEGGWTGSFFWELPKIPTLLIDAIPARTLARLALRMNFGDARRITDEDVDVYTNEVGRPGAIESFVAQQRQLMPSPEQLASWTSSYSQIRVPVLVLWGTADAILNPKLGERFCKEVPSAEMIQLQGVGHAAQLEVPEVIAKAIVGRLSRKN